MAEDTSSGADATVATQETETTEQGIQQQGETYAPEELEEIWGRAIDSRLSVALQQALTPFQRQLDQRLTRIEQLAPRLEELQPQLEKVMGSVRDVKKLNRDILSGKTLTEEQVVALDDAEQLEQRQEQATKQQQEKDQLQRQVEEAKQGQLTSEQLAQMRHSVAWVSAQQDAVDFAHDQGYRDVKDWEDVKKITGDILRHPSNTDEFGYQNWKRDVRSTLLKAAAARDAEGNAMVNVPSQRGGGGQSAADIVAAYGRDENPIPWSPKVAAAMKELGLST